MRILLSILLIIIPVCYFLYERYFIKNSAKTKAFVVGTERRWIRNGRMHYPVLSYKVDGIDYKTTSSVGVSLPFCKIGSAVEIFYNLKDPNKIMVNGGARIIINIVFLIFLAVGTINVFAIIL